MTKQLPAPTAQNINEAHRCARESAENAVEWAVKCGHMLIALKEASAHGEFENNVRKTEVPPSTARLYMRAARENANALAFSSLRTLFPSGKQSAKSNTPKGAVSVVNPEGGRTTGAKEGTEETGKDRPAAPVSKPEVTPEQRRVAQEVRDSIKRQQAQTQVAEEEPERPDLDDDEEDAALARAEARAKEDRERRVDKILESDEQLAEALKQLAQQSALIGTLETTRDSYMRGKDAVTKMLQAEQRKVTRLEKENKSLRERIASLEAA